MTASGENIFYTGRGYVAPVGQEKGGCQFVFYNPNSKEKHETRVYIDTIRLLANFLGKAQKVVQGYYQNKEKLLPDQGRSEVEEVKSRARERQQTETTAKGLSCTREYSTSTLARASK